MSPLHAFRASFCIKTAVTAFLCPSRQRGERKIWKKKEKEVVEEWEKKLWKHKRGKIVK